MNCAFAKELKIDSCDDCPKVDRCEINKIYWDNIYPRGN